MAAKIKKWLHTFVQRVGVSQTLPVTDKYRRIDGLCNHRDGRGSAGSTLRRLVPNAYEDGEWI